MNPALESAGGTRGRLLAVWHNGNLRTVLVSQLISQVGSPATFFAIQFLAFQVYGADAFYAGLLGFFATAPYAVFSVAAGIAADRVSKRAILLACDLLRAGLLLLLTGAIFAGWGGLPLLCLSLFCMKSLDLWFDVAFSALIPALRGAENAFVRNSAIELTVEFGKAVGNGIAGLILAVTVPVAALLFDAATFLASAFFVSRMDPDPRPAAVADRPGVWRDAVAGFEAVRQDPGLRTLIAVSLAVSFLYSAYYSILFYFCSIELRLPVEEIGLVFVSIAVGGSAAALLGTLRGSRLGLAGLLHLMVAVRVVGWGLILLSGGAWTLWVLILAEGAASASITAYNVAAISCRQALAPPAMQGKVVGFARFITWGGVPLGALAGGALMGLFQGRMTIALLLAALLLCGLAAGRGKGFRAIQSLGV